MKTLYPYLLALTLLVLLVVGSHFAQARPAVAEPEAVDVRSTRVARYLAASLELSRKQQKAVSRSTRQYFQQLATLGETTERPGMVASATEARLLPSPAALKAADTYEQELARIFTPGQYNAYSWLIRQPGTGR
ncbi:hypothetical protein [Hymenobacter swuensis]|uniref:DUF4168 domain-containing protein n=1 Tax=Hymenobacter swuensis DY53 TaxID=1227739 RepID=W8F619_9BACT|nr:hypothetical protein [Hymenobacter swuensis]AHJ99447.1 hypothetical protein Hsw_3852 [Hymenobacter swuensis DY53]